MNNAVTFTPAQASSISGVSPSVQRDWRRHGYLSAKGDGWTTFGGRELAELFLLKIFNSHGKLKEGAPIARELARPLGDFFEALLGGERVDEPEDVAVLWADGTVSRHPNIATAFANASSEQQNGPVTLLSLGGLATPLFIKLRDFVGVCG